jgi:hypothetical protein
MHPHLHPVVFVGSYAKCRFPGGPTSIPILVLLVAAGACRELPLCDSELKPGTTYLATITEYYSQDSSAKFDYRISQESVLAWRSCKGFDGLVPGSEISLSVTKAIAQGGCKELSGVVLSLPNGETWEEGYVLSVAGGFDNYNVFTAEGEVTGGECRGPYKLTLARPEKSVSIFSTPRPGELPGVLVGRTFRPTNGDSSVNCGQCADTYVAQLALGRQ